MSPTSDPIELLRDLNPVSTSSLGALAAERADELLAKLRAGEIASQSVPPHRRRRYLLPTAVALAAAAVATGAYALVTRTATPQQSSPPASTEPPGTPAPVGRPVANAAQADALLSFNVVLPSNATAEYMNVYKWDGRQQLQGYYDTSPDGLYSLTEEPTQLSVGDLRQLAKEWKSKVVVVDGVHVLVREFSTPAPKETFVEWIRGDGATPVLTQLDGPWIEGQPFTEQQALSVAANIIGQGG